MAKKMSFTDEFGNQHPQSYWRLTGIRVNILSKIGEFIFSGYKDKAARNSSKKPFATQIIAATGANFDRYYAMHLVGGKNLMEIAYLAAGEIPIHTGNFVEQQDEDGNVTTVPETKVFFQGATDDD